MPPRRKARSVWDEGRETPHAVSVDAPELITAPEDDSDAPGPPCPALDPDRVTREAIQFAKGALGYLLWMDARFVAQGQSALSPWWRHSLNEFFESGKTWGVFLAGRGSGKSTTLERVAILYVLFGCLLAPRKVPPGQRWMWPFISASTADAGRRIREIQALLLALGLEVKSKLQNGAPTMELTDVQGNAVSFVSIAATIAGVSGPSALGATIDEEAKLRDRSANVNPSTEIIASVGQMLRARAGTRIIRCSSAWKQAGSHWAATQEGDTAQTHVARIGTDFLAPTIDGILEVALWEEQAKRDLEAGRHLRVYATTLTAQSPNVCTWVGNPTISAMSSRMQVEGMPVDPTEGNRPRWQIWLRENASMSLPGSMTGAGCADFTGLAEAITKMNRAGTALHDAADDLGKWDNLPSYDPRSKRYHGSGGGTNGGML